MCKAKGLSFKEGGGGGACMKQRFGDGLQEIGGEYWENI